MTTSEPRPRRRILLWALLTAVAVVCLLIDVTYFDDVAVKISLGIAFALLTVLCSVQLARASITRH